MPEQKPKLSQVAQAMVSAIPQEELEAMVKRAMEDHALFIRYITGVEEMSRKKILAREIVAADVEENRYVYDFLKSFSLEELERIHFHMHYLGNQWSKLHSFLIDSITERLTSEVNAAVDKAEKAHEN